MMTFAKSNEFANKDGSINTTKAMHAGHDERSQTLRKMFEWVINFLKRGHQTKPLTDQAGPLFR